MNVWTSCEREERFPALPDRDIGQAVARMHLDAAAVRQHVDHERAGNIHQLRRYACGLGEQLWHGDPLQRLLPEARERRL